MTAHKVAAMADVEVVMRGDKLPARARRDALKMVRGLAQYAREPILHARVRLARLANPAVAFRVIAQVELDVNGRLLRAHAAARSSAEAIGLLRDRMRQRLVRSARHWEARRGAVPSTEAHQWRHGQQRVDG
jgi:ribosome-associated translation inhibitor RaiA